MLTPAGPLRIGSKLGSLGAVAMWNRRRLFETLVLFVPILAGMAISPLPVHSFRPGFGRPVPRVRNGSPVRSSDLPVRLVPDHGIRGTVVEIVGLSPAEGL